jgi:hypothetical protein
MGNGNIFFMLPNKKKCRSCNFLPLIFHPFPYFGVLIYSFWNWYMIHDPQDIGSFLTSSFISKFHYMFCYIFSHLLIFIKFSLIHQITQWFVNSYTFSSHFYFKLNLFIARILVYIYIYWIEQVASNPGFISDLITMFIVRYYLFLYIRVLKLGLVVNPAQGPVMGFDQVTRVKPNCFYKLKRHHFG